MTAVAARRVGCGSALAAVLLFHILDVGYLAHFLLWTALALPVVSLLLASGAGADSLPPLPAWSEGVCSAFGRRSDTGAFCPCPWCACDCGLPTR